MILDDGGDATLLVHLGVEKHQVRQAAPSVQRRTRRRVRPVGEQHARLDRPRLRDPWCHAGDDDGGHRPYERQRDGSLLFPAINANDAVTQSKFDNTYGCRHSLVDGINRATDVLSSGKTAVVCGYGDVGKGCAESLRGQGARVIITEIDPICALQAAMDGFQVTTLDEIVETADIFVTTTGNKDIIMASDMARMKHQAIVGNIGPFDDESDMAALAKIDGIVKDEVKPQVHTWTFPDGKVIIVLSEGRLLTLGNATGPPRW
jgi:adenosylhomocysteinase